MRQTFNVVFLILMIAVLAHGKSKEEKRLENCAKLMTEILNVPENVPLELLDKAECVAVIPAVKKFAFGFGGSYGAGVFVCRKGESFRGSWSPPAMYRLEGGSIGFQLGGSATDFILLVMNPRGAKAIIGSKVKLGVDASAAAGPKGRTAEAATDATMRAEILTYSRSRGAFAGISLKGSTLRFDKKANKKVYGRELKARQILRKGGVGVPAAGQALVGLLNQISPKNRSK